MPDDKASTGSWSLLAHRYAEVTDDVRLRFLHPAILGAVTDDTRERSACLDYGCGPGHLALALSSLFDKLVLVDIAPGALEEASRRLGARAQVLSREEFAVGDATFDAIVLSLVLTTLADDKDVGCMLQNLSARLTKGGRLFLGTTHPCFTFSALSQVPYCSTGAKYQVQIEPGLEITEYHRPLSRVIELLVQSSLRILRVREVYDDPDYYRSRGEEPPRFAGAFPMFLILTCDRPSSTGAP